MARILVTETIAERGLDRLRQAGHEVDVRLGLTPAELLVEVAMANAVVIRSETQITAEVLAAGIGLVVVGRAGIGLDNVDVAAATLRGVMVVNAPQSNVISAAEHAMALLLALARNLPQAHGALKTGKWQRTQWTGVELHGKVLGVVGLGRVGALVAQRALAFGMQLVAYDPYVTSERARQMGVQLMSLDNLVATADFVTVHLPTTPETLGLIGRDLLARAKPGLRVVNTARGGIVDEDALAWAIREGLVAGAALDVFAKEPTTESPLFALDSVVVTPHLGASTTEAQDKAGETIAEQVQLALAGDFVPYAVNVSASEASETVRPFLALAERLGGIFASLNGGLPPSLVAEY
ncbi:MAG: NAD(P)-dependent oxidoreductase [Acidimicrobiales bacterium]